MTDSADPTIHYDTVVDAWGHLLGDDLHYGFFEASADNLAQATDALTDLMIEYAAPSLGQRVLDIGCGTGRAACRLASEYQCEVIGITPSRACLNNARQRAIDAGVADQVVVCGVDGTQLAFADASFDRIWIMESSHLMGDKTALLSEAARVLKPGGRLVLCDIVLINKLSLLEVIEHRDEFLLLKDAFGRAIMQPLDYYREQMQSNGLSVLQSRDISTETLPTFRLWQHNAEANADRVQALIGEAALQQFQQSCDVLKAFWENRTLGYAILSAEKPAG